MSPHKPAYANRFRISNYSDLFWGKNVHFRPCSGSLWQLDAAVTKTHVVIMRVRTVTTSSGDKSPRWC